MAGAERFTKPKTMRYLVLCMWIYKLFSPRLYPWGWAEPIELRPRYASIDNENDSLRSKYGRLKKIFEKEETGKEKLLKGPETVIFGNGGEMYVLTENALLVKLSDFKEEKSNSGMSIVMNAKTTMVADLGVGRPLGSSFTKDGTNTLYIADAHLGLIRLKNPESRKSKVELVASSVFDEEQKEWTQILYANDVVVGPKSGKVYFTDSSTIPANRVGTQTWDTMYASKSDLLRSKPTGRLLEYDPKEDKVTILAKELHFPNGISVGQGEKNLLFTETFSLRIRKYSLVTGRLENLEERKLTGYPDGIDCGWSGITTSTSNLCYAVMPSAINPIMKIILLLPHPIDMFIRSIFMALPKELVPSIKPYGGIVEIDPRKSKGINKVIQDPNGEDIGMLTGVTVHDDKLYLGSLENNFIGVYSLEA